MAEPTIQGGQIGSVITMNGSAWAISGNSQRPLEQGAPVYEGEKIVTESDSNVEIQFADDTILGQGENSATQLDEYVYTGDDGTLDFQMIEGALRVVSGEIVKMNPDNFNLETPLATIGIRGTQVMIQIDQGREIIGVDELGEGHHVIVKSAYNEVIIDKAGMFSGVDFDGSLIVPDEMPDHFMDTMTRAVPLTLIGDSPRLPGDSQTVDPPQFYETINNQTGEYQPGVGMEYAEEDEDAFVGDEFDEDFELSEEELEAMLGLETAAGTEEGAEAEQLGQVVDLGHDPFDPELNDGESGEAGGIAAAGDSSDGEQSDDDDDLPEAEIAAAPPPEPEPTGEEEPQTEPETPPTDSDTSDDTLEVTAEDSTPEEGETTASATITTENSDDGDPTIVLAADDATWDAEEEVLTADDGTWDIALTADGYEFTQHDNLAATTDTEAGDSVDINVTVTATDTDGDVGTGSFTVSVTDEGPVAQDATLTQETEDTTVNYNVITEGDAATGTYGGTLTDVSFAPDNEVGGSISYDENGTITFTPTGGESGTALFTYTIEDADGDTATGGLSIALSPDSAPEISVTGVTGDESEGLATVSGSLDVDFGADADGASIELASDTAEWDAETRTLTAEDSSWDIALTDTGYTFTQYEAFDHSDGDEYVIDVTLTATDGDSTVATGEFSVTISDAGPTATDASIVQEEHGETVSYNVFTEGAASLGIDGGELVDAWLDQDSDLSGTVSFDSDGTVTYEPAYGETGTAAITYVVEDGDGDQATAQIELSLDDIPVITTSDIAGDESDGLYTESGTLDVSFGDDADGASYVLSADNAEWDDEEKTLTDKDGKWTIELAGATYVFTQNAAISHADTNDPDDPFAIDVTVTATDGDGSMVSDSFTVTVDDDGPSAGSAELTQDEAGDEISYNVFTEGIALTGLDGGSLTNAVLTPGSDYTGTVSYDTDGTITYTPAEDETGTVTVDYTVTDGDGDAVTSHLAIELAEPELQVGQFMDGQGGEVIVGGSGDDTIDGAQGRDVIFGTGGDDSLVGGNSPDVLFGGDGDDALESGKGNDKLAGEGGMDTLTGGKGSDTFVFTSPEDGEDVILDFETAKDQIELYEATFDLGSDNKGNVLENQFTTVEDDTFTGGYDFEDATSGLVYASDTGSNTGALFYDPDDTVDGDETLLATITEDDGNDLAADNIDIV